MIVYVESNFVLELALRQEEHEACEEIARYAEARRLQLVVPAFSLAEPCETWHRRARDLSPQDAFVYASVEAHLRRTPTDEPKIFVTRDPDDFATPEIEEDLGGFGATILPSFGDATAYLEARLGGT